MNTFRQRVVEGWNSFLSHEAELRKMIDEKRESKQIIEKCQEALAPAFCDICFELGYNGEKYELILTPEGKRAKIFPLVYFQQRVPAEVLEHWNILVGRQPGNQYVLRMFGQDLHSEEISVWTNWQGNKIELAVYCEKLAAILKENENNAYWVLSVLLDQVLGEIAVMKHVYGAEILTEPLPGECLSLNQIPDCIQKKLSLEKEEMLDIVKYCNTYLTYEMEPDESEDAELRADVFAGVTRCLPLLEEYFQDEKVFISDYRQDGIAAGFFYYPLYEFTGEDRAEQVLDFRDRIEAELSIRAGTDSFLSIGGASGIYYGYLDFIAWDLVRVLEIAVEIFEKENIPWVCFQNFHPDMKGIILKEE